MRTKVMILITVAMMLSAAFVSTAHPVGTYISQEIQETCEKYGKEYGICPELLMAIIERESAGQADAENGGCKGLMQISEKWHIDRMERLGVTDIYDVDDNIHTGTDYLAELMEEYGEVTTALMVYHGERDAVARSKDGEISNYAGWILDRSAELERERGK